MRNQTLPPRSGIPIYETWNLDNVFPDVNSWETAKNEVLSLVPELAKYKGILSKNAKTLADFFELFERALRLAAKVSIYGSLATAVDTTDQEAQARAGQGQSVYVRLNAATAFVNPDLMGIGFAALRHWIHEEDRLSHLEHFIDRLEREKDHFRSDEVEEILALSGEPLSDFFKAYTMLTNADLNFNDAVDEQGSNFEVGQSSINSLLTNQDRNLQKSGFNSYADGYLAYKNTIASIQLGGIHSDIFNARARNYTGSLAASLSANNIPQAVFHALIDTFRENLPTWHRYWDVRKRALGYDEFHIYDIKAPLSDHSPVISFEQAIQWICEGMAPLGQSYVETLRKGALEERWVDRARNRGKRQGAFSSGAYDTNPFIMMSYANDIFSMSTLAHELGHSLHSYYTRKTQPFVYSRYSLFVAEVASNFNQAMVRDYLIKNNPDPGFQLALIEEAMSNFHRYFFIMPTLARWELEMHERAESGKPLTADIMNSVCAEFFAEGYGDNVIYDKDRVGITWAQFQHMYMNFYVYQYATGISAAHALAIGVQDGSHDAVDRYLNFLSAGGSVYPLDALKQAGVDMTSSEPVNKAFAVMAGYVDRLEALVEAGEV